MIGPHTNWNILNNGEITIDYPKKTDDIKELPLKELAIPKKLVKDISEYKTTPIHIRAIKSTLGLKIEKGETVYFLNLIGKEVIAINGMETEEIEKLRPRVDFEYIYNKTIKHKIELLEGLFKHEIEQKQGEDLSSVSSEIQTTLC